MMESYDKYMQRTAEQKFCDFVNSRQTLALPANYWINFENVKRNAAKYGPGIFTLDYLIGKDKAALKKLFLDQPNLLKLIPPLLGIRNDKFEKPKSDKKLKVEGLTGDYLLDFKEIQLNDIDLYLQFIHDSGLEELLLKGITKSLKDYSTGVEAGMDSNGRKNRSGQRGELYIESVLRNLADKYNFQWHGQSTYQYIKDNYKVVLDQRLSNVRFDGSLYDVKKNKLYLFEINNFSSQGSKLKASGGEFSLRQQIFDDSIHDFIYITDGQGWDSDLSHLKNIIKSIKYVFNFSMIQAGYLEHLIQSSN
ncbi:type II restriction endonuclease [Convivina praedatoris]|uniref:Type-2 restriction enzyme n=1 Tax=Convivina praedatoris TaxID=2880963 RepID=A0ABN8HER4_9LACO|nr:type II restriction endonuclease [Convivina sp. LMG 32447]CAH1856359.1 Type-2 restriction enzyme MboI [Convivina sp. LMG 32447]CAH1857028.1 Type-2 restriction enzyme MboI [Convivina sp. LMG 32447]